jgi:hypothetical protein
MPNGVLPPLFRQCQDTCGGTGQAHGDRHTEGEVRAKEGRGIIGCQVMKQAAWQRRVDVGFHLVPGNGCGNGW